MSKPIFPFRRSHQSQYGRLAFMKGAIGEMDVNAP